MLFDEKKYHVLMIIDYIDYVNLIKTKQGKKAKNNIDLIIQESIKTKNGFSLKDVSETGDEYIVAFSSKNELNEIKLSYECLNLIIAGVKEENLLYKDSFNVFLKISLHYSRFDEDDKEDAISFTKRLNDNCSREYIIVSSDYYNHLQSDFNEIKFQKEQIFLKSYEKMDVYKNKITFIDEFEKIEVNSKVENILIDTVKNASSIINFDNSNLNISIESTNTQNNSIIFGE